MVGSLSVGSVRLICVEGRSPDGPDHRPDSLRGVFDDVSAACPAGRSRSGSGRGLQREKAV